MAYLEDRIKELEERVKQLEERTPFMVGPTPAPPFTTAPPMNCWRCRCGKWVGPMEVHTCVMCGFNP